jgi:hypothetical protein
MVAASRPAAHALELDHVEPVEESTSGEQSFVLNELTRAWMRKRVLTEAKGKATLNELKHQTVSSE